MCVTMGPPIRGDPISHSQAHSFVNVVNCGKGEGTHVLAQRAGNFFFPAVRDCPRLCARTNPWFRGQTLLVLGHGGGGVSPAQLCRRTDPIAWAWMDSEAKPYPKPRVFFRMYIRRSLSKRHCRGLLGPPPVFQYPTTCCNCCVTFEPRQ